MKTPRWPARPGSHAFWEAFLNESDPSECNDLSRLREWLDCYQKSIGYSEASEGMVGKSMLILCREREVELRRRIKELEDMEWALKVYADCEAEADLVDRADSSDDRRIDDALLAALSSACARISIVGYIYFQRWSMPDGTSWYKVGITSKPTRRDAEQNVLPVASETLACVNVGSMDRARALEALSSCASERS